MFKLESSKESDIRKGIGMLGFMTGMIFYIPYDIFYGTSGGLNDNMIGLIISIILILAIFYTWIVIYKQFKKDKTKLGFSLEEKWSNVVFLGVAEVVSVILIIIFWY